MFKSFFSALSSKVFGSGQSERSPTEDHENSSSNAIKESSADPSAILPTDIDSPVQKNENLKVVSTDITVSKTNEEDKNNSGHEVANEKLSSSIINTEGKNDNMDQETSHIASKTEDQVKEKETCTGIDQDFSTDKAAENEQDMSEWVTLEMPKGKRSPRNQQSKSPRHQGMKSSPKTDVSVTSGDPKSSSNLNDVMKEKASTPDSKFEKRESESEAVGDARESVVKSTDHLDEDSFSSMLVSSMLEEIVGQMSEVTVKDTMSDTKAENTNQNNNNDPADSYKSQDDNWRAKKPNDTRRDDNWRDGGASDKSQEDGWRAKGPNRQREEYSREKPQRGKKGMRRWDHKQGYNDDHSPSREGKGDEEMSEERKNLPPIDPNLEKEDFLEYCKMSTERDKLIRAKKLIYRLGYLKDVPLDEIKDVILGQYNIAARRSVHGWIEDARYFSEVMISQDWIDDNILYLNPRLNKKSSNKRIKNRYMEKEDSFARKTGGLCQDVRLLTNPNLTVVRVSLKSSGGVEKISDNTEPTNDAKSVDSNGGKTGELDTKTKDHNGKKEDGPVSVVNEENKEKSTIESQKEDEDIFQDCSEEYVKNTNIEEDKNRFESVKTSDGGSSSEAVRVGEEYVKEGVKEAKLVRLEEESMREEGKRDEPVRKEGEPVEQGEVAEVVTLMEECMILQEEQDKKMDKDIQKDQSLMENCDYNESEKQSQKSIASNDSFRDPAIIMMIKSSYESDVMLNQPSYDVEMPVYDPKCDVLSGLFRMEEDPRNLIETIMRSDSPTEPSVTRDHTQSVMMSRGDPTMVMENDSQLIDYLLNVTEEPKNPVLCPEIPYNMANSSDSLTELDGIEDFITDMVTSKICDINAVTDIDTAGIGDGAFGEEVVNLDLVKEESVMKLIEQCQTEDLTDAEICDGAGEAPALEEPVVDSKESIQHYSNPAESEMVCNLLQDLPILHQEDNENSGKDCINLSTNPDHQERTENPVGDEYKQAVVKQDIQDPEVTIFCQDMDVQLQVELVESQTEEEPYSPTQGCTGSYTPVKSVHDPFTQNITEPFSPSPDK